MANILLPISSAVIWLMVGSVAQAETRISVAVPYLNHHLDPFRLDEPINTIILANITSNLTAVSSAREYTVNLARSASVSEDGLVWSFSLPEETRFESGGLLDADAVAEALNLALKKHRETHGLATGQPTLFESISKIKTIAANSKKDIQITLIAADPNLPLAISFLPIIDPYVADIFADDLGNGTNFSGAGPYQVKENFTDLILEASSFFRQELLPKAETLTFRVLPSAQEALSALRAGTVEAIVLPTDKILELASSDTTLEIINSPLENYLHSVPAWRTERSHWSEPGASPRASNDQLRTDKIIIRRGFILGKSGLERFDLRESYLP